ncbi:MAG: histidinol-phosphate aminotransferase family protein [Gemmatimonadetes bacterium]|nr:histidinol-phosphate aminotransferase family protein [Gemmatimonadota bacterium]
MTPFPRQDYASLRIYDPGRRPVPVDLSDNTNLWGPNPGALARIRSASPDDVRCYPEVYADTLRAAVAERFGVSPDCVTTGAGSDDILDSAFRAVAGPGDTVAFPAPTFVMAAELALVNGMRPRPVPWRQALADPRTLLEGDPAVVYLCRPNNPTGSLAPGAWVERLLDLAGPNGPLVVLDEAYADFAGETLIGWAVERPKLLVARTCSKAYGLAGLRCGFAVARPEVALEVEKSRGPYKVSRLTAAAAAVAVRDAGGWSARTVTECLANRERLFRELVDRGLRPQESSANFILFAAPSGSAAEDAIALREQGVGVRPFQDIPELGDALRVTVAPWPLLERFLEAMDRRLAALEEISR